MADYANYTVAMHRELRTPLYAALNIDQASLKTVERSNDWRTDTRIGDAFQLNNDYYFDNPWDRGHLARRAAAAWGASGREAKHASDDTFFFSNSTLQHRNFNQDEWLELENWVKDFTGTDNQKITSISGPVFGGNPRSVTPPGRPTALVPSAFFKVIAYVQAGVPQVRAFLMPQDAAALRDKSGRKMQDNQRYQVSVTEIEERTGLLFDPQLPDTNPIFFNPSPAAAALNVTRLPERREVDMPEEVIREGETREVVRDDEVAVYIAAAMVNAAGDEHLGEWITILNLTGGTVDLSGWTVSDEKRKRRELSGSLLPGEALRLSPVAPLRLSNQGGVIYLYDAEGARIDRVKYTAAQGSAENRPVIFNDRSLALFDDGDVSADRDPGMG
nr:DNA/RNA non-specific endonuclease [Mangrovicoccus sp. HB161399]